MTETQKSALIADDTPMHRSFLKVFLLSKGFAVDTGEDGLKALALAKTRTYSLVFSDMEMPNMNGLEFLRELKSLPNYKAVPVIMLTTVDKPEIIERAKRLGALHYMIKPFTNEKMIATLAEAGFPVV